MAEGSFYGKHFETGRLTLQASDVFEGGVLLGKTPARKIGADPGGIRDSIRDAASRVAAVAGDFGVSPSQLALAFCLAYEPVANVLFGVSRMAQLEDNLGAVALAASRGAEVRSALADLWLDRSVPADGTF